ncbi:hypothetical protein DFH08DRAFT_1029654 [Mycena albidolilacea]|uniref:Uncharacterized protein n=1 Tax=Mycena albidolilacea TaxID=1033008 RepID=A0AAD6ZI10_9AGAR|nr:hypothetical protein DFH08DRAFT_1029654 [Mycena albidolilacea]
MIAIHLALLAVWALRLELRLVFALQNQNTVSFFIAATATTFGTVYSAVLVFLTQTLAMRRSLRTRQMLTATHDSAAAWAGISSAFLQLWQQRAVRRSTIGVASILVYLGTISALHIITSTLFFLDTFNSSQTVNIPTRGLPAYNYFAYDPSKEEDRSRVQQAILDLHKITII